MPPPAPRRVSGVYEDDAPYMGAHVLPDLVEAAIRCGEAGLAKCRARVARRAGARGRHPAGARAARPVPGAARRRRQRRAALCGGYQAPEAVPDGARARPRPPGVRGMAAPPAPPPRRAGNSSAPRTTSSPRWAPKPSPNGMPSASASASSGGGGPISSRLLPFTTALDTDVTRLGSRPGYPLMAGPPAVARWWRAHLEPVRRRWPRSSL